MRRRAFLRTGLAGFGVAGLAATPAAAATSRELRALFDPRRSEEGPVRLSSNENPLGLAPSAREAVLGGLDEANRYPGATASLLREALATRLGVAQSQLLFGSGSTEILRVAVDAWATAGGRLIYAEPTFEDVPNYSQPFPYDHVPVPLTGDHQHDIDRMRAETRKSSAPGIIYLCNPNNPTGTLTASDDIEGWIAEEGEQHLFLIDEAYFELADAPGYRTAVPLVMDHPNVLVVRTFSKVYAMAGMRLGYGIAHPATVDRLRPFGTKNQPNHLAGVAAIASLDDADFYRRSVDTNLESRELVAECLDELGIEHLPSHTNFLMHRIRGELATYNERMFEAGFNVGRPFPPMTDWSRLSMGLPEDMARFADTLRGFRERGWI